LLSGLFLWVMNEASAHVTDRLIGWRVLRRNAKDRGLQVRGQQTGGKNAEISSFRIRGALRPNSIDTSFRVPFMFGWLRIAATIVTREPIGWRCSAAGVQYNSPHLFAATDSPAEVASKPRARFAGHVVVKSPDFRRRRLPVLVFDDDFPSRREAISAFWSEVRICRTTSLSKQTVSPTAITGRQRA